MYVCICKGITDSQIRDAVNNGASSLRKVRKQLGATSQCGKCGIITKKIVDDTLAANNFDNSGLFYALS